MTTPTATSFIRCAPRVDSPFANARKNSIGSQAKRSVSIMNAGHPKRIVNSNGQGVPLSSTMQLTSTFPQYPSCSSCDSSGSRTRWARAEERTYRRTVPISPVLGPRSSGISFLCSKFSSQPSAQPPAPHQAPHANSMPSTFSCNINGQGGFPCLRFHRPSMNRRSSGVFAT
jgi:hypothetical protein